jgi:S-adenosylmethionine:diacylglycerol 3-amino-3-carboxypropyl transferase
VDNNPAENALLELKMAAIKHLSYEDYLLILGEKEDTEQKRFTCDTLQLTLF